MFTYKKWSRQTFVTVAIGTALLSGCSPATDSPKDRHLTFVYNFATLSLDPHRDSSYVPLRAGVTETLVRLDDDKLTVEPWLAKSWTNESPTVWRIVLQEGIQFQNGEPLDASAVKGSLERSIRENAGVKNALNIKSITVDGADLLIETRTVYPEFISELVNPNTAIIDIDAKRIDTQPVGTGPFAVSNFSPGTKVDLTRFDGYWGERAKLESVDFLFNEDAGARTMALQSGQADVVYRPEVESVDQLKNKGLTVEAVETFRVHQLTMNVSNGPMQSLPVRQAIDALVDRDELVDHVLQGYATVATGPFIQSFPFAPTYEKQTQRTAVSYLKQAGYTLQDGQMQKNGQPLTLTLLTYSARPDLPLIAQVLQDDAKKIGVTIKIKQIDVPEEYMSSHRDWDLATYSNLTAPRGDAGYYLHATYHPQGGLNFSGVNDPSLTRQLDRLKQTVKPAERNKLAEQIAREVDAKQLNSFLLHPSTLVAYDKTHVKGWKTEKSEYYMITNQLEVR